MFGPSHPYLQPVRIEFDLGGAARRDPIGHRLHIFFGLLWCFSLGLPTTAVEIGAIPLIVYFLLRTPNIWRTWGSCAVQSLSIALACWVCWQAATLFWTPDLHQGLKELSSNRWLWALPLLWPIMERRRWLIAAMCVGFLCGNLSQVGHEVGHRLGIAWLTWPRFEDRNSGWWDPVVGGSLLVGALGLHLPAAVMGSGRWRWVGIAGCVVTLMAIGATGTRGAWLAAAGLVVLGLGVALVRLRPWTRMLAGLLAAWVALVVVGGALWIVKGDSITRRVDAAKVEIDAAIRRGDYSTDTGARVQMAIHALRAIRAHPIRGIGAGGFRSWMSDQVRADGQAPAPSRLHAHAHNAPLQIAATTGMIGLLLAGIVAAVALRGAFSQLGPPGPCSGLGSYAAGPGFAIIGLLLVGMFDPVQLNAQTAAFLSTLMALSLCPRPVER